MNVKSSIYVTNSDNELYFDGKLSKKELLENSILRIVRDVIQTKEWKTGVVTRRGKSPLEVIDLDGQWHINKEIEKVQSEKADQNISVKNKAQAVVHKIKASTKKNNKPSKWDRLTQHERNLIICVKYDIHDDLDKNEILAKKGFDKDGQEMSFSGIPRFKVGDTYTLNNEEYKVTNNNGKHLLFSFRGSNGKAILETDLIGEFIRPIKNKMDIIHSEDEKII